MIKFEHLNDDILEYILAFLTPFEYSHINTRLNKSAHKRSKIAIRYIERWYLRHRVPRSFEHFTPKSFLVQFHKYRISTKILHRKCLPEYIACVLDLRKFIHSSRLGT